MRTHKWRKESIWGLEVCIYWWGKEVKSVSPKTVMMIHVFWDMTPCHWARVSYISEDCRVFFSKSSSWKTKILLGSLDYEDECTMIFWNTGNYLPNNTVSYSKIWIVSKTAVGTSNFAKRWCLNFEITGSNSLALKEATLCSYNDFKLQRYLLSVCFCADVLNYMGHSYLQLICNGCYPWVVLHLENRLVAYQIKISCKMKHHMLKNKQQWKLSVILSLC